MRKFDATSAVATVELQQLVFDYWHDVDHNHGANAAGFCHEDVIMDLGAIRYEGRDGFRTFYRNRLERMRADGVQRATRHVPQAIRVEFDGPERATLTFLVITYGGAGALPVAGATAPEFIPETDCGVVRSVVVPSPNVP